jgi:thiol-disulfide isomerase/thioredoxin
MTTHVARRFSRTVLVAAGVVALLCVIQQRGAAGVQDPEAEYAAEIQKGEAALNGRRFDEALDAFRRASALRKKTSAEAHFGIARAYLGLGDFKNAVKGCEEAAKYTGDDRALQSRISNQRGLALFGLSKKPDDKHIREAESAFRSALSLDGRVVMARYNLGVVLLRQGRDPEGIEELQSFIASAGTVPEAAEARRMIEDPRRAREAFAPDFSIVTMDEQTLTLEDLKGRVVLLDFWATWCGPCVAATPGLVRLQKKYKDEPFTIVGVSLDNDINEWRSYVESNNMVWPQYHDRRRTLTRLFRIEPIPTYVLLDHDGIVRGTRSGWSPTVDLWLDGQVKKYLKAMRSETRH